MSLQVDIQCATAEPVPDEDDIRRWIAASLTRTAASPGTVREDAEICVRLVDADEMATLNATYRDRAGPTNVLSFPASLPAGLNLPLLGDIVICAPVVRKEAVAQHKTLQAHWAHMAVHGTLHLLGYDHIEEEDAAVMEALESAILAELHYPCPYRGETAEEHSLR
jgi:probable rRNA maturation factor